MYGFTSSLSNTFGKATGAQLLQSHSTPSNIVTLWKIMFQKAFAHTFFQFLSYHSCSTKMRIQNNWNKVHRSNSVVRKEIKWYINICPCLHPGIPGHLYGPSSFFQKPARFLRTDIRGHWWACKCSQKKKVTYGTYPGSRTSKMRLSSFNNLLFLKVSWFQRSKASLLTSRYS